MKKDLLSGPFTGEQGSLAILDLSLSPNLGSSNKSNTLQTGVLSTMTNLLSVCSPSYEKEVGYVNEMSAGRRRGSSPVRSTKL